MKSYLYTSSRAVAIQQTSISKKSFLLLLLSTIITLFAFAGEGNPGPGGNSPGGNSTPVKMDFKNPSLIAGVAGADGATYKFAQVDNDIDAQVKIVSRSNALVTLVNIDLPGMGYDKAFQPQVMYNGGTTPAGLSDWWMEFEIKFVKKGTNTPADPFDTDISGIDIDGNGQYIKENVHFYGLKSYSLETGSLLQITNLFELLGGINTLVGKRFDGPTVNFLNIDTSGTPVMATANYKNVNKMRIRVGGASTGASGASDRMYSLYFKSFRFNNEVQFTLPLVLKNFNAVMNNKKVSLDWVTGHEKDLSHFVVERSTNGVDYTEAGIVFAMGNSTVVQNYKFVDALNTSSNGVVYYRLKMMDDQKHYQYSPVRLVRLGNAPAEVKVQAYPNPVVNELRITIPEKWQNKQVSYELYNVNGNLVKRIVTGSASQTETMNVTGVNAGNYVLKAYTQDEVAAERIVKK